MIWFNFKEGSQTAKAPNIEKLRKLCWILQKEFWLLFYHIISLNERLELPYSLRHEKSQFRKVKPQNAIVLDHNGLFIASQYKVIENIAYTISNRSLKVKCTHFRTINLHNVLLSLSMAIVGCILNKISVPIQMTKIHCGKNVIYNTLLFAWIELKGRTAIVHLFGHFLVPNDIHTHIKWRKMFE